MASDRARISFDPTRDYRSVIAQQGRVTLEADVNEAAMIATEALRLETIDIVGPDGTPDNGYAVSISGGVTIGVGTLYLGGWRLTLAEPVNINAQPDWLDGPSFTAGTNDVVSLLITEQSVCAVEDQALREIALGGPDTAARYRLMQHFLLTGMDGYTCADGLTAVEAALAADGCTLDPKSDQILSGATLLAGFVAPTTPPDPCSPAAAGGYLGADNQLVRVTVTSFVAGQGGTLLWGWNNASFLYRATLTDPGAGVFTLTGAPVDEEHAPQLGQAVEILRTRADLGDGNYIAADAGFVTTVAQAYSVDTDDTGRFTIADPAGLPPDYAGDKTPLFVRLWQAEVPFTAGQPAPLDTVSGLTVTVELTALPTQIAARPFWRFAVRPDNPAQVYPERYLDAPQPPDGPRQWICDLAVVQGGSFGEARGQGGGEVLADCRKSFNPLTDDRGGCCGLTLDPEGVDARGGLQAVADSLAGAGGAVLSLKAGTYVLPRPLLLGAKHAGITIEGCSAGVIFEANPATLEKFILGMVITLDAVGVTLQGIDFLIPNAPVAGQPGTPGSTLSLGVLGLRTLDLTVEACRFRFVPPEGIAFGAGVAVLGPVEGLTVKDCEFAARALAENQLLFGILSTITGDDVSTGLDAVEIRGNLFENLTAGVTAFARLGMIRCEDNRVKACGVGLYFAASNMGGAGQFAREAYTTNDRAAFAAGGLGAGVQAGVQAELLARTATAAAPLFTKLANPPPEKVSTTAQRVLVRDMNAKGTKAWTDLTAGFQAATPAAKAATAPRAGKKVQATPKVGAQKATAQTAAAPAAASANLAYTGALDQLETLSMAAEVYQNPLLPVLHIVGNDIALISPGQTPGVGIGVLFSPKAEVGEVLLSGNRVTTPDTATVAAAVMFPAFATATGNMLLQPPNYDGGQATPAFILIGDTESALLAPMGNVVRNAELIAPPRASSAVQTTWEFLNTEP